MMPKLLRLIEQFWLSLKKGGQAENRKAVDLHQRLLWQLVAGAGFEPTTFGL